MPDPCDYDDKNEFVSDCIAARQHENPDEGTDQSVAACNNIWDNRDCKGKTMPDNIVHKAGAQSADDPYEFIMSTDTRDRMGDVVEQDWNLRDFKKNPVALWSHKSYELPVGTWKRVRVEAGKLRGRLELAEKGTSDFIDTLRSLIEQRIVKAVSVGFSPGKAEPLDEKDPWAGYRLSDNVLLECSPCSVPANPEALSLAKSWKPEVRALLLAESGEDPLSVSAAKQLGFERSRASDKITPSNSRSMETKTMTLSEKIQAAKEKLAAQREALTKCTDNVGAEGVDQESNSHEMEELTTEVDKISDSLESLLKAEASLAARAFDRPSATEEAGQAGRETPLAKRIEIHQERKKGHRATGTVACLLKAHVLKTSPFQIAKSEFKDEAEFELLVRAATDPATMGDAAWAGPLVRETWSEFLDLVRDMAIYPNLPGMRLEFDRYGKITVPRNEGRGALAGGFVAEGAPIPVKEGVFGSTDLSPKAIKVITSFTKEIAEHSMPAIQALVQNQMTEDTAEVLDTLYLDANARDTIRPAGMQDPTETGAPNIVASTGNTVAAIIADTKAAIGRLLAARIGGGAVWIMNPLRVLGLTSIQDAASGAFVFRDEISNGTFRGYPFLESQNVPADLVVLQGNAALAYANDYGPRLEVSDETVLVYDDTAPDDVLPDTNVQPAKSMFQIDSVAVKWKAGMDWRIVRANGVQCLTSVDW